MYTAIRYILIGISIILIWLLRKRIRYIKSCIGLVIVCNLIIWHFPIENLFFRFSSPEAALDYVRPNLTILQKYESHESEFVVFQYENSGTSFLLVERDSRGWKAFSPSTLQGKTYDYFDGEKLYLVKRFHGEGLKPTFLFVTSSLNETLSIKDSISSDFELGYSLNHSANSYFSFTDELPDNYKISINGIEIQLGNGAFDSNEPLLFIQSLFSLAVLGGVIFTVIRLKRNRQQFGTPTGKGLRR